MSPSDHPSPPLEDAELALLGVPAAARALARCEDVVVLTGAGISVESGIPDFRSPGGLWERFDPFEYATRDAFAADPARCWELFRELDDVISGASPNPAHRALAQWERLVQRLTVVTQNIDGLHHAAGSGRVVEFHGSHRALCCVACGARFAPPAARSDDPPRCACGAIAKPDVVLFGDPIPFVAWSAAVSAVEACDGMVVIGTSAQVAPFSELPWQAARRRIPIVEINLEPTGLSALPTLLLQGPAGWIVPALVAEIGAARGSGGPG